MSFLFVTGQSTSARSSSARVLAKAIARVTQNRHTMQRDRYGLATASLLTGNASLKREQKLPQALPTSWVHTAA